MTVGGPSTDDVQGPQFLGGTPGTPHGFAINGDLLEAQTVSQGFDPTLEAGEKGLRIDLVKDAFKGVVRRNAVGQSQVVLEPVVASLGEGNDLLPVVGAADRGTQGDDDDVHQQVTFAVVTAPVAETREMHGDRQRG